MDVRNALTTELDPVTLYRILALRVDVFVVEQNCPYPDLDGRDLEPDAHQLWVADGDAGAGCDDVVLATLRLLTDAGGERRIGRVATAATARGSGLAASLMTRALALTGDAVVVLDAQAHLERWYGGFGFLRSGPDYVEDDIPHVPMRRSPHS